MKTLDDILDMHTKCLVCSSDLKSEFEQERGMCLDCDNLTERISKTIQKEEANANKRDRRFVPGTRKLRPPPLCPHGPGADVGYNPGT